MKTEISRFCETCLETLDTLPPALNDTAEQIEKAVETPLLVQPLAILNDVRARLRSLHEKLGSQQAYLLIFGPLKSGKSTLMNAISGAYVSEVTSLPGYPCLVFVRHAEAPHFSVTRYNGRESVFADGNVLRDVIADSHVALAEQIRATEKRGDDFDPRTHFTEAIRRVDIKVPVQSLAESSTVLVDTPGLYSRMNFGYDVLTREFRDSAACAVFVVKTDNLFLEQVFAEFNQLLDLFSRIFLVINVDSSKRDLQADGTLLPSAESHHPEQIIEAFKTLSMAGPLRKAYEEKRVRIHAVDLMNAASGMLTRNGQNGNGHAPSKTNAPQHGFDAFLLDLTDYLNSSDYTLEFIRDSLRQGATLCEEARAISDAEEIRQVRENRSLLETEMGEIDEKNAAIDRLLAVDWDATFEKARSENASLGAAPAKTKAAEVSNQMRGAIERWFETNEGLKTLEEKHWNPTLATAASALAEETRGRLRRLLETPLGGSEPAALAVNDLHSIGFDLGGPAHAAQAALDESHVAEPYRMTIKPDDVPVRKSFADWILFRSAATVRRRVFGENLAQEIEPEEKQKRLPETSRDALVEVIDQTVQQRFPMLPGKFADTLLTGYVAKFREEVTERLRQQREDLVRQRAERQAPYEANGRVLESLQRLSETAVKVASELERIGQKQNAPATAGETQPASEAKPAIEPALAAAGT